MTSEKPNRVALVIIACMAAALSACTQSTLRISPDFGSALHQDIAAQIADPDAHYEGVPTPGSAAARVTLAQKRYEANRVIQPSTTTASSSASIGRADNGNGAGTGAGMGASAGISQ